jgi:hypothetical protein
MGWTCGRFTWQCCAAVSLVDRCADTAPPPRSNPRSIPGPIEIVREDVYVSPSVCADTLRLIDKEAGNEVKDKAITVNRATTRLPGPYWTSLTSKLHRPTL